jgi:hypothetical protein
LARQSAFAITREKELFFLDEQSVGIFERGESADFVVAAAPAAFAY